MATADDVIARARLHYPDLPAGTLALTLLQEAHDRVLGAVRLRPVEEVTINLTSGTYEYALSDDVIRVWAAVYVRSSIQADALREISIDMLDDDRPNWRYDPASTPTRWYDVGTMVGLFPKPDTTTSGGYPILKLYTTKRQTLTGSTTMPAMVPNYDAWVSWVCRSWAWAQDRQNLPYWEQRADETLADLIERIQGRQARLKPSVLPSYPSVSNF